MKDIKNLLLALGLVVVTGACSSSEKAEDDFGEFLPDEVPVADADTDMLPAEGMDEFSDPVPGFAEDEMASAPVDYGAPTAVPGEYQDYTVQAGDTLMKIAFETYGDLYQWRRIYEANRDKLQNPNVLPAGVTIRVENPATPVAIEQNGERYLIKKGDTLGKISSDVYGTPGKWRRIWENNRKMIKNPDEIFAGFYLYYQPGDGYQDVSPMPMAGAEPANPAAPPADELSPAPAAGSLPPADSGFGGADDWGDGFEDDVFDDRQPSSE